MKLRQALEDTKNSEAAKYIEVIASQTNTDVKSWDVEKIFGSGSEGILVKDKKEINRRFFTFLKNRPKERPNKIERSIERKLSKIGETIKVKVTPAKMNALKIQRDKKLLKVQLHYGKVERFTAEVAEINRVIHRLDSNESAVSSEISKVLSESFWEFHELRGTVLSLVTRSDVILTQINSAHRINLRVNMGRYKVNLNFKTSSILVRRYKDNVSIDGHCHPHVSSDGHICWGNASDTVYRKLSTGEFADIFRILASVLTSYNDANPYVCLYEFDEAASNRRRR